MGKYLPATAVLGLAAGACYTAAELAVSNRLLQATDLHFSSPHLPPAFHGLTIVQLSDLHGREFGPGNGRLVQMVRDLSPDLVALTGDLADGPENLEPFLDLCQGLRPLPCYYVPGTHEQGCGRGFLQTLYGVLGQLGVTVLDGRAVSLRRGEAVIHLAGMHLPGSFYKGFPRKRPDYSPSALENALGPAEGYTVLLAHNPFYFPTYAAWGADLTLSGHVHGGMIRLPGVGGLLSPERRFFPAYDSGLYTLGDKAMAVSRGLGGARIGPRFRNRPQVLRITLEFSSLS